jgi:hypothetical protein
MEISKEDQERMEKEAECYASSFKVNQDLPALKDLAKHDYRQGIFHEHLTQVLPLRKQIEELKRWKEEMTAVWADVDAFARLHTGLGESVSAKALDMMKKSIEKDKEIERLTELLHSWNGNGKLLKTKQP